MEHTPSYSQGHLMVAAVRVLEHRLAKPPTYEEIGELLGISHEVVGAMARSLESAGIVKILKTPFDTRVEVKDHLALEELPREEKGAAMKGEVEAFLKKARGKQEALESELASGDFQEKQKKKFADLESQLKDFQKKKAKDPFARPPGEEETGGEGEEEEDRRG
ncbi:MAG: helix-turn-helix domain-containing protein [bacterium]